MGAEQRAKPSQSPLRVCRIEHAMIDRQAVAADDARPGVRHKEGPGRQ